jgi:hypothetical protein
MADMMMPGTMAPEPPSPSMDQLAAFEQMRQQVSPTEVNQELLGAAEQADPVAVAEFKRELASLNVAPEVIDMLRTMVDEVLADPGNYPAIRQKYLSMGVDEELLPEAFDASVFAALNMALDQLGSQGMSEPMPMLPPQAFARGGIASLRPMAREMAAAGRNGDTMLAHISPVEAQILRRYGGSGTINPVTGAPEYSLKSMFKKIGKAVKKFASTTIGKIIIGTALFMVAGPAAASMLGASAGSAVSAGISGFVSGAGTTLLAGGNLKQALKAGAVGGLTAGVAKGVMNRVAPPKLPPGATSFPATDTRAGLQTAPLPSTPAAAPTFAPSSPLATPPSMALSPFEQSIKQGVQQSLAGGPAPMAAAAPSLAGGYTAPAMTQAPTAGGGGGGIGSLVDKTLDRIVPSRIQAAGQPAAEKAYADALARTKSETLAVKAYEQALPGMRAYLPMAGLGIAALGAMGGFEEQPAEVPPGFEGMVGGQGASGVELLAKYPERYGLVPGPTQVTYAPVTPAQLFGASRPQGYASGGQAQHFPRKNGAIDGPGTATSDSIPAMLSDGEFVFTAKAVRAMGDGSRRKGAKRMYALMRKLEGRSNG